MTEKPDTKGTCPTCGQTKDLTIGGQVAKHPGVAGMCGGSGFLPVAAVFDRPEAKRNAAIGKSRSETTGAAVAIVLIGILVGGVLGLLNAILGWSIVGLGVVLAIIMLASGEQDVRDLEAMTDEQVTAHLAKQQENANAATGKPAKDMGPQWVAITSLRHRAVLPQGETQVICLHCRTAWYAPSSSVQHLAFVNSKMGQLSRAGSISPTEKLNDVITSQNCRCPNCRSINIAAYVLRP